TRRKLQFLGSQARQCASPPEGISHDHCRLCPRHTGRSVAWPVRGWWLDPDGAHSQIHHGNGSTGSHRLLAGHRRADVLSSSHPTLERQTSLVPRGATVWSGVDGGSLSWRFDSAIPSRVPADEFLCCHHDCHLVQYDQKKATCS